MLYDDATFEYLNQLAETICQTFPNEVIRAEVVPGVGEINAYMNIYTRPLEEERLYHIFLLASRLTTAPMVTGLVVEPRIIPEE